MDHVCCAVHTAMADLLQWVNEGKLAHRGA